MGKLEAAVRKDIRRTRINKTIITTLAVAGILSVAVLAPSVLGAMGRLGLINPSQKKQSIKKSLTRLIEGGYVRIQDGEIELTKRGEILASLMGQGSLALKKPRRWDRKWRVLVFDIPERRKTLRNQIRSTLINLGFERLQDSVWIYPYDCEDLITLLKADLKVGKDVLYVIADRIEYDAPLRKTFGVS